MFRYALLFLFVLSAGACTDSSSQAKDEPAAKPDQGLMRVISGEVFFRERRALPPGATYTVVLEDQSRMDAPAQVLAEETHEAKQPPFAFRMVIDPRKLDERHRYGLRARIELGSQLLFTSTEHIDPLQEGPIRIMVSMVKANRSSESPPSAGSALTGQPWLVAEIGGSAAVADAAGRFPDLQLDAETNQVAGYAGCNQFTGPYTLEGDAISLGPLAATRKMCVSGMEQESQLLQALGEVTHWAAEDGGLTMMDEEGNVVLRLKKEG